MARRPDHHELEAVLEAQIRSLVDDAEEEVRNFAMTTSVALADFIEEHGDSSNFAELADHFAVQQVQHAAITAWNLQEAARQRLLSVVAGVARAVAIGLAA